MKEAWDDKSVAACSLLVGVSCVSTCVGLILPMGFQDDASESGMDKNELLDSTPLLESMMEELSDAGFPGSPMKCFVVLS